MEGIEPVVEGPKQSVLVTTRAEATQLGKTITKDNIITIDWHTKTSFNPELYIISVGKSRFSLDLIRQSKVFAINFMPFSLKKEVEFCGRNSGKFIDKFKETNLTKEEAETIDCPIIKEAIAYMECEVIQEVETGDHILFIGKVNNKKIKDKEEKQRVFHTTKNSFLTTQKQK